MESWEQCGAHSLVGASFVRALHVRAVNSRRLIAAATGASGALGETHVHLQASAPSAHHVGLGVALLHLLERQLHREAVALHVAEQTAWDGSWQLRLHITCHEQLGKDSHSMQNRVSICSLTEQGGNLQ